MSASFSHQSLNFQHHSAEQAQAVRGVVEEIYRRSYTEAIVSGDPFDAPEAFMERFNAYTNRDNGFDLVITHLDNEPVGQTWGWPLNAGTRWWSGLQLDDGDLAAFTAENGVRTFALSEIMVCANYAGRGIAHRLQDALLAGRPEQRATLLVEFENTKAYDAYRSWGWNKVGTLRPEWPDAPLFDVLIRNL